MREVASSTFTETRVDLDNVLHKNCKFVRCTMVFSGTGPVGLEGCAFHDCAWKFEGAAESTLLFMAGIYKAAPELIEATFNTIRRGRS